MVTEKEFLKQTRLAAKGTRWRSKQGVIVSVENDWILSVNRMCDTFEFRARLITWNTLLWEILQIEGNEEQPISFHYWGAFTCSVPAIAVEHWDNTLSAETLAFKMVEFGEKHYLQDGLWRDISFDEMLEKSPVEGYPHQYLTTKIISLISSGKTDLAKQFCKKAISGEFVERHIFSSVDQLSKPDSKGRRNSLSFYELALLWLQRC